PFTLDPQLAEREAGRLVETATPAPAASFRTIEIPTTYEGPDLEETAERSHLAVDELIALHADRDYRVFFLGFLPGFAYCDPLAFAAANALVGNGPEAAAIEIVGAPFVFACDDRRVVAVTGRDVAVQVRDRLDGWTAVFVRAGMEVRVLTGERSRFTYLAVS